MKVVADTLGVARSHLVKQLSGTPKPRSLYQRQGDDELLAAIQQLTDARPTYGYRRITALLNRARRASGAGPINHKRVFRLMAQGQLLLQPHVGHRPIRAHEGRVIALASNQRWSFDSLEISCWNGEVVRLVFAIDTCDREIIAWQASTGGISGEMVRDLMLACVERRFNALRAPHPLQWLADNGSAYAARETLEFAVALALVPSFTPVRSPESNGVSEAFVKTLKRDYARIQPRPDALTVLQQLPAWIDDYNENHPHSGLRMHSPREFTRLCQVSNRIGGRSSDVVDFVGRRHGQAARTIAVFGLDFQFQGSNSSSRCAGWEAIRASTSANQACGSTYHAHTARRANPSKLSARARRDLALQGQIKRVWEANFQVYGVRKVWR